MPDYEPTCLECYPLETDPQTYSCTVSVIPSFSCDFAYHENPRHGGIWEHKFSKKRSAIEGTIHHIDRDGSLSELVVYRGISGGWTWSKNIWDFKNEFIKVIDENGQGLLNFGEKND